MTAAYRLKGLGWFAGCALVTLSFYLVSLQVASERKRVDQVNAKIRVAEREIRALETEFDTRANLVQLERWNGDTLSLIAPGASQFVADEAQLASIRFDGAVPDNATTRTAGYVVPSMPALQATLQAPVIQTATATAVASAATRAPAASAPVAAPASAIVRTAAVAKPATAPAVVRKAQAVAMLDKSLLSDSTIGDLLSGARTERGRLR